MDTLCVFGALGLYLINNYLFDCYCGQHGYLLNFITFNYFRIINMNMSSKHIKKHSFSLCVPDPSTMHSKIALFGGYGLYGLYCYRVLSVNAYQVASSR